MIYTRINWCEKSKHQVYWLPVHRIEFERLFQTNEDTAHVFDALSLRKG